jgi:hypothetical protein
MAILNIREYLGEWMVSLNKTIPKMQRCSFGISLIYLLL